MANEPIIQCPACQDQTASGKFCIYCGASLNGITRAKNGHPVQKIIGISFLMLIAILGVYAVARAGSEGRKPRLRPILQLAPLDQLSPQPLLPPSNN
jgi:hypothetical protein